MAVDIEALKALGMSDKEINQLISIEANGFPSMTATPQPVTNRVAGAYDYTPLYGGGEIIPGLTASIFQNLGIENPNVPVFELLGSANKGGKNANERMVFAAQPGQSYRLVNKATGEVLGEASTPEGISALVQQSNALSKSLGKKADIAFEQSNPEVFGGGYTQMFRDQPNELVGGFLGNVMDVGIPLLSSLVVPGAGFLGTILPAAAGSAASSAMQGRSVEETLLRAALSGAGAGVGEKFLAPAIDAALKPATQAVTQAGTQAVTQAGTQAGTQAVTGGVSDILVNALPSLASRGLSTGITSLATSLLPSPFDSAQPSTVDTTAAPTTPAFPEEILVTAKNQPFLLDSVAPALTSAVAATAIPELTTPSTTTAKPEKKGIFEKPVKDWGVGDWLDAAAVGGVGADLLKQLIGGSGGEGTAVPYVSPFGPGMGAGGMPTGPSRQLNPTIADYERYGFGPEALFFAPQSNVVAPTTTGPAGAMVNPRYEPLI